MAFKALTRMLKAHLEMFEETDMVSAKLPKTAPRIRLDDLTPDQARQVEDIVTPRVRRKMEDDLKDRTEEAYRVARKKAHEEVRGELYKEDDEKKRALALLEEVSLEVEADARAHAEYLDQDVVKKENRKDSYFRRMLGNVLLAPALLAVVAFVSLKIGIDNPGPWILGGLLALASVIVMGITLNVGHEDDTKAYNDTATEANKFKILAAEAEDLRNNAFLQSGASSASDIRQKTLALQDDRRRKMGESRVPLTQIKEMRERIRIQWAPHDADFDKRLQEAEEELAEAEAKAKVIRA